MVMTDATIRRADRGDACALARVIGQLGYPTDKSHMRARLNQLLGEDARVLLEQLAAYQPSTLPKWIDKP